MVKTVKRLSTALVMAILVISFSIPFMMFPGKVYGANTLKVGPGETYTTIQAAVNAASDGDTIQVAAGTYDEGSGVDINKADLTGISSIIIKGAGADNTTVTASGTIFDIAGNISVDISGFTIDCAQYQYGISISNTDLAQDYSINDNIIKNKTTGENGDSGIYAPYYTGNLEIFRNEIRGADDYGIFVRDRKTTDTCEIYQNIIEDNDVGLHIDEPWGSFNIHNNDIMDNPGNGIHIYQDGDFEDIIIYQNNFSGNGSDGGSTDGAIRFEKDSTYANGVNNVDATDNWWGYSSGPTGKYDDGSLIDSDGLGDAIYRGVNITGTINGGRILFDPYLTSKFANTTGPDPDSNIDSSSGSSTSSPIKYVQQIVGAGSVTVDASGAYAIVTGSGGQTITIDGILSSSASERGFSVEGATIYGDLKVNSSEGIEKIQFTIIGGAGKPWWLSGSTWIECSDYTIEPNGDVIITITNSTSPKISELTGTVFTVFGKPWVRTMPMTCSRVWINEDNNFQFVFQYPYRNNNWVRIYDAGGKMVYEIDMPYDDPNLIVNLPDGMYTVKTFTVGSTEPIQTFVIGK